METTKLDLLCEILETALSDGGSIFETEKKYFEFEPLPDELQRDAEMLIGIRKEYYNAKAKFFIDAIIPPPKRQKIKTHDVDFTDSADPDILTVENMAAYKGGRGGGNSFMPQLEEYEQQRQKMKRESYHNENDYNKKLDGLTGLDKQKKAIEVLTDRSSFPYFEDVQLFGQFTIQDAIDRKHFGILKVLGQLIEYQVMTDTLETWQKEKYKSGLKQVEINFENIKNKVKTAHEISFPAAIRELNKNALTTPEINIQISYADYYLNELKRVQNSIIVKWPIAHLIGFKAEITDAGLITTATGMYDRVFNYKISERQEAAKELMYKYGEYCKINNITEIDLLECNGIDTDHFTKYIHGKHWENVRQILKSKYSEIIYAKRNNYDKLKLKKRSYIFYVYVAGIIYNMIDEVAKIKFDLRESERIKSEQALKDATKAADPPAENIPPATREHTPQPEPEPEQQENQYQFIKETLAPLSWNSRRGSNIMLESDFCKLNEYIIFIVKNNKLPKIKPFQKTHAKAIFIRYIIYLISQQYKINTDKSVWVSFLKTAFVEFENQSLATISSVFHKQESYSFTLSELKKLNEKIKIV